MVAKILLILFFLFTIESYAEDIVSKNKNEEIVDINNEFVIELKAQLQEMKIRNDLLEKHQSSLLSTIHWSLSFLGGVTILLIGYGWWSNSKVHEKDKQELKQEISSLLGEWEVRIKLDNADVISEQSKTIDNKLIRFDEQLKGVEKSLDEKLEKLFDESRSSDEKLSQKVDSLAQLTSTLIVKQTMLGSDVFDVEERVWELKGITANVLLTQAQGLDAARELGSDYGFRIKNILSRIQKTLESFTKTSNPTLKSYFVDNLKKSLNNLDSIYSVEVSEVLELLDKVKIEGVE
ncbi:hypothetical protein DLR65_18945 [Vibrio tarriae]|uniref:hypothetical protein n=1 Tax=Vibrio tarriae TaxID=2014742 RepID=UPI000DE2BDD0|nr:hypothetical protein [Vibrio tarriae]RBM44883.1 hypothetical protein DLR65_18945 [Vibrio tarriae]